MHVSFYHLNYHFIKVIAKELHFHLVSNSDSYFHMHFYIVNFLIQRILVESFFCHVNVVHYVVLSYYHDATTISTVFCFDFLIYSLVTVTNYRNLQYHI